MSAIAIGHAQSPRATSRGIRRESGSLIIRALSKRHTTINGALPPCPFFSMLDASYWSDDVAGSAIADGGWRSGLDYETH